MVSSICNHHGRQSQARRALAGDRSTEASTKPKRHWWQTHHRAFLRQQSKQPQQHSRDNSNTPCMWTDSWSVTALWTPRRSLSHFSNQRLPLHQICKFWDCIHGFCKSLRNLQLWRPCKLQQTARYPSLQMIPSFELSSELQSQLWRKE